MSESAARSPVIVYALDVDEVVSCYYCEEDARYSRREAPNYRRGQAFLCGADHPPFDANANYICRAHLADEAEIVDLLRDESRLLFDQRSKIGTLRRMARHYAELAHTHLRMAEGASGSYRAKWRRKGKRFARLRDEVRREAKILLSEIQAAKIILREPDPSLP